MGKGTQNFRALNILEDIMMNTVYKVLVSPTF